MTAVLPPEATGMTTVVAAGMTTAVAAVVEAVVTTPTLLPCARIAVRHARPKAVPKLICNV